MTELEQFYKKTVSLIELLETAEQSDRDEKVAKIEQLLTDRDKLLKGISAPFSSQDKELGEKTAKLNKKLVTLLTREKTFIQKDLRNLQHKKKSSTKYTNPYKNIEAQDGIYYDKRN